MRIRRYKSFPTRHTMSRQRRFMFEALERRLCMAAVPVWVFTSGGKSIAEAASHEAGHALGLSHDGTPSTGYYSGHGSGDTGWAPITGVGYYKSVTQWDDGTYFDSNNGGSGANDGKGPDDLAVFTTYNGFGYRAVVAGNVANQTN